jgi:3-hydroxyisobutyrate dehydrogenase
MASSSNPDALSKAKFLLSEMSDEGKLFLVDGGVGQGSNMKMVHQVLAGNQILSASEGMGLAANLGLNPETVQKKVCESDAWSWMFENRVPRMLEEDYFPGVSALNIIVKDVVSLVHLHLLTWVTLRKPSFSF